MSKEISYLVRDGKILNIDGSYVIDPASKQSLTTFIAKMEAFKTTVDTFLTGDANGDEVIDRLSELVASIEANKDLIAQLTGLTIVDDLETGGADAALSAEQGKALKQLIDKLPTVLDKLGENAEGQLTFDGNVVGTSNETGIAFGTSEATATDYTGRIQIITESIEED